MVERDRECLNMAEWSTISLPVRALGYTTHLVQPPYPQSLSINPPCKGPRFRGRRGGGKEGRRGAEGEAYFFLIEVSVIHYWRVRNEPIRLDRSWGYLTGS